jgi:hypothetical protein
MWGGIMTWLRAARRRLGIFGLSLLCGIALPLSTLPAEQLVKGEIDGVSWFAAGVTYAAGIGLVSRSSSTLLLMLLGAIFLAFVYGVDMTKEVDWPQMHQQGPPPPLHALWAEIVIGFACLVYCFERFGRHIVEGRPFLET